MTGLRISESAFQVALIEYAHLYGWWVSGFRRARTKDSWRTPCLGDAAGWPDLILVKPGRSLIIAELKTIRGKLTLAQTVWQQLLQTVPGIVYKVWTPDDWDEIEAVLK